MSNQFEIKNTTNYQQSNSKLAVDSTEINNDNSDSNGDQVIEYDFEDDDDDEDDNVNNIDIDDEDTSGEEVVQVPEEELVVYQNLRDIEQSGDDSQQDTMSASTKIGSPAATVTQQQHGIHDEALNIDHISRHRQQLELSDDSPFNNSNNNSNSNNSNNAKQAQNNKATNNTSTTSSKLIDNKQQAQVNSARNESNIYLDAKVACKANQTRAKSPSLVLGNFNRHENTKFDSNNNHRRSRFDSSQVDKHEKQIETKFRPLTGKVDCPNCECDQRRKSVCDTCFELSNEVSLINGNNINGVQMQNKDADTTTSHMTPSNKVQGTKTFNINDNVLPINLLTLNKSLNNRCSKLAKAIEDLTLMMDKVQRKSDRLDQERKLVLLYKDQWKKFGPVIGGQYVQNSSSLANNNTSNSQQTAPIAKPRRTMQNYQSRFDPELARDTRALNGYKQQLQETSNWTIKRVGRPIVVPQSSSTTKVNYHRSKSMFNIDLNRQQSNDNNQSTAKVLHYNNLRSTISNSTSNLNNNTTNTTSTSEQQRHLENQINSQQQSTSTSQTSSPLNNDNNNNNNNNDDAENSTTKELNGTKETLNESIKNHQSEGKSIFQKSELQKQQKFNAAPKRLTWVPVFGETQIKQQVKAQPNRKVTIFSPTAQQISNKSRFQTMKSSSSDFRSKSQTDLRKLSSHQQQSNNKTIQQLRAPVVVNRTSANTSANRGGLYNNKLRNKSFEGNNSDSIANQVGTKLQLATELLNRETSNVNKMVIQAVPAPIMLKQQRHQQQQPTSKVSSQRGLISRSPTFEKITSDFDTTTSTTTTTTTTNTAKNISNNNTINNSSSVSSNGRGLNSTLQTHKQSSNEHSVGETSILIDQLKNQLAGGQTRLAQILHDERRKHERLQRKVDSSLRKQSDLEAENEMLKQSLNKCIDTCLKDISQTFESIGSVLGGVSKHSSDALGRQVDRFNDISHIIAESPFIKQMSDQINELSSQRKSMFDELSIQKQRNLQLETTLQQTKADLDLLLSSKQNKLATNHELTNKTSTNTETNHHQQTNSTPVKPINVNKSVDLLTTPPQSSSSMIADYSMLTDSSSSVDLDTEDAFGSLDLYRRYIESISPDIEAIRRERKLIINEFENIKQMLSEIETQNNT